MVQPAREKKQTGVLKRGIALQKREKLWIERAVTRILDEDVGFGGGSGLPNMPEGKQGEKH